MDLVAHGLWAGIGVALARRHRPIAPRTAAATITLAVAPDLVQLLPLLGRVFTSGEVGVLLAYASALPEREPALSPTVAFWTHHLHCVMHSGVVAAAVTLIVWAGLRSLWLPLLGWWSHIVIDVFTHSADFYPSPVLYPFTQAGFDGVAWNTPWFMVVNYVAIGLAVAALALRRPRHRTPAPR